MKIDGRLTVAETFNELRLPQDVAVLHRPQTLTGNPRKN